MSRPVQVCLRQSDYYYWSKAFCLPMFGFIKMFLLVYQGGVFTSCLMSLMVIIVTITEVFNLKLTGPISDKRVDETYRLFMTCCHNKGFHICRRFI